MADEGEGSFRIGDVRRTQLRGGGRSSPPPTPEENSVGFPAIEGWLERGTMDELVDAMRPRYEALEGLATSGGIREKGGAKKAMGAYERVADLFEYLYSTKDSLHGGG